jgi:hypothetical protein
MMRWPFFFCSQACARMPTEARQHEEAAAELGLEA